MIDMHQFMRLTFKRKMNRLDADRIVGAPTMRQLDPDAVNTALKGATAMRIKENMEAAAKATQPDRSPFESVSAPVCGTNSGVAWLGKTSPTQVLACFIIGQCPRFLIYRS
ncbi:hypothetical protein [Roseovarius sp. Pro17]|uniref:hypothetical protein n=1 Tax=Roseovarius sp. Pro17 TaxID=3108175 RepID=UPI002D78A3B7|nr:hypothetical protein [Roseovarius sp. Pro17]